MLLPCVPDGWPLLLVHYSFLHIFQRRVLTNFFFERKHVFGNWALRTHKQLFSNPLITKQRSNLHPGPYIWTPAPRGPGHRRTCRCARMHLAKSLWRLRALPAPCSGECRPGHACLRTVFQDGKWVLVQNRQCMPSDPSLAKHSSTWSHGGQQLAYGLAPCCPTSLRVGASDHEPCSPKFGTNQARLPRWFLSIHRENHVRGRTWSAKTQPADHHLSSPHQWNSVGYRAERKINKITILE